MKRTRKTAALMTLGLATLAAALTLGIRSQSVSAAECKGCEWFIYYGYQCTNNDSTYFPNECTATGSGCYDSQGDSTRPCDQD